MALSTSVLEFTHKSERQFRSVARLVRQVSALGSCACSASQYSCSIRSSETPADRRISRVVHDRMVVLPSQPLGVRVPLR
jgi:hypothetical protein